MSPTAGLLEARDEHTCVLRTGARTVPDLAHYLQEMGLDFTVEASNELRAHLARLAERLSRAADGASTSVGPE